MSMNSRYITLRYAILLYSVLCNNGLEDAIGSEMGREQPRIDGPWQIEEEREGSRGWLLLEFHLVYSGIFLHDLSTSRRHTSNTDLSVPLNVTAEFTWYMQSSEKKKQINIKKCIKPINVLHKHTSISKINEEFSTRSRRFILCSSFSHEIIYRNGKIWCIDQYPISVLQLQVHTNESRCF